MASEHRAASTDLAWQYEALIVHIYGNCENKPSIHLQLVPVFFNPLCQLSNDQQKCAAVENKQKQTTVEQDSTSSLNTQTVLKADNNKWRNDTVDHYLQRKRKRVVSAYMDNHKISSLLRTFEIMSCHKDKAGTPVTIRWLPANLQEGEEEGGGGYVGIVSGRGDMEINKRFSIGMVKIVVDQHQDIVMLRSSTLDCYLTGHSDSSVVDGRANSTDVTACHWKVVPCKKAFQDCTLSTDHVILQYWSKRHCKDNLQDGLFFVIKNNQFKLESFSFVKEYGVFRLQ